MALDRRVAWINAAGRHVGLLHGLAVSRQGKWRAVAARHRFSKGQRRNSFSRVSRATPTETAIVTLHGAYGFRSGQRAVIPLYGFNSVTLTLLNLSVPRMLLIRVRIIMFLI